MRNATSMLLFVLLVGSALTTAQQEAKATNNSNTMTFTATIPATWGKKGYHDKIITSTSGDNTATTSGPTPTLNVTGYLGGDALANQTNSPVWKSGYLHGYERYPLNGAHTMLFIGGYMNGTLQIWGNRGYACGLSAWKCHIPNYDSKKAREGFIDGNRTGAIDRVTSQNPYTGETANDRLDSNTLKASVLPAQSNDSYWQYYIGMYNGGKDEGNLYESPNGTQYLTEWHLSNYCHFGKEYCAGYAAGWNKSHNQEET